MWELYLKGGFLMHPILIASITALAIFLERGWFFRQIRGDMKDIFEIMAEHLSKGDLKGALRMVDRVPEPIGIVLREGLRHLEEGPEIAHEAMAIRGAQILRSARKGIPVLALISSVTPMIGLLGTITGMVAAFQQMAGAGEQVSPALLASGIWTALITTVGGLLVAIPALIVHHYFEERISRLSFQIEHYGSELLLLIKKDIATGKPLTERGLSDSEDMVMVISPGGGSVCSG